LNSKINYSLITFTILLLVGGFTYRFFDERESERLFKNSSSTSAVVNGYHSNMGATYINYEFVVDGEPFVGSTRANSNTWKSIPVGTDDLRITYAVEDPQRSIIIDSRFVN
jgi:hypothetical protein